VHQPVPVPDDLDVCAHKRDVGLMSDALPFGRLWYGEPNAASNAVRYARFYRRSHDAVIRVYDEPTYEHKGEFKEW